MNHSISRIKIKAILGVLLAGALIAAGCSDGEVASVSGVSRDEAAAEPTAVSTGDPTALAEPTTTVPTPAATAAPTPAATTAPTPTATDEAPAAGTPATPTAAAAPSEEPGLTVEPLEFADCGQVFLCGTLVVPIDHDNPDDGTLELRLGMIPASDPQQRIGAILVNPGGPGGAMDGLLSQGEVLSARIHERFDVVGWNPRGVGHHVSPECTELSIAYMLSDLVPDDAAEEAAMLAAAEQVARVCQEGFRSINGRIGTDDTVRDMDLIRAALGEDKLNYLGYSYGSLLGQLYADRFGDNARVIVIDGVIDPSLSGEELAYQQMVGFNRVVEDVFASCEAPGCPFADGDIRGAYEELMARVEDEPLLDEEGNVVAGPGEVALALVIVTYVAPAWPLFYQAVADGLDGDGAELRRLALFYADETMGPFISIGCTDYGHVTREENSAMADRLASAAGDLGRVSAAGSYPCEYWDEVAETFEPATVRASDAPTILVLGNKGDNATPYEWAVAAAESLDNSLLVSYDGLGHTSYGKDACVDTVVDDYFIDLTLPDGDIIECP